MREQNTESHPTITVLGSLNMDLVNKTDRIPEVGETVLGGDFRMVPGGKGANQAVAASRLGSNVIFLGKVGRDYFGKILVENLEEEGIETENLIETDGASTGVAEIIVDSEGNNIIAVAPGANAELSVEDIEETENIFANSDLVLTQLEVPIEVVEYSLEKASDMNVKTVLNPAPARKLPEGLLEKVDVLVPNEIELMDIAGMDRTSKSIENAGKKILKKGPEAVVVTLGGEGALLVLEDGAMKFEGIEIEAVDTTGAGDAFCAGLAIAIASGKSLQESVEIGNLAGALATTRVGAQEALPTLDEIEDFKGEVR